jgi:YqaJ-like viral recombinase domain
MKLYRVEQGSVDWYRLRLGKPTSSNFHRIVTPLGAPSKQAVKYLYRLVAERLLNETMDDEIGFVKWVASGKENEPFAVKQFEFVNEVELEPGGFVTSDDGRIGASPDRIFKGHKQSLEIKSPAPWTQLQYLLEGPDDAYIAQTQGHLLVGDGFDAVHFYSYNSRTPPFHQVVRRDPRYQGILAAALDTFCDSLDKMTERARALGAFSRVRIVETPADVAYQQDEYVQLRLLNPEDGDIGDAPA